MGPFVFTRRGSQFFDEDGDLAHEFYEEQVGADEEAEDSEMSPAAAAFSTSAASSSAAKTVPGRRRCRMRRKFRNLSPQGTVKLPFPRLHGDLPVVLCHVSPSQ